MPDQYVDAIICGVEVKKLKLMESKFGGYDPHTGERFKAGTLMAYLHQDRLTDAQKKAIFPDGRVTALTVQWPMKEAPKAPSNHTKISKPVDDFTPSQHQMNIWADLWETDYHILVEALAGSGKTSTLVWLVKELAKRGAVLGKKIIYLAFNTKIKAELSERLEGTGVPAMTTHGFGYALLRNRFGNNLKPEKGKCASDAFTRIILDDNGMRPTADGFRAARKTPEYKLRSAVLDLVGYIKNSAIFPTFSNGWSFKDEQIEEITKLVAVYGVEIPPEHTVDEAVGYAVRVVIGNLPYPGATTLSQIDFDDMLYLPLALNLAFPHYDLVLTDESQDFNNCQILMLERLVA